MKKTIKEASESYLSLMKEFRHYLHMHPELSFKEKETSAWIRNKLKEFDIPMMENISGNSVVGYLQGASSGPVIAFRADIDALPIQEENEISFKSTVPNVMHACGHDSHTATLLTFAKFLKDNPEIVNGKVVFIFQQGEELIPGGAQQLIEDGVLEGVDAIFAWHIGPQYKLGQIDLAAGAITTAVATYSIKVKGKGGHGGFPFMSISPISAASLIANAIYGITAQNVDPAEVGIVTVSHIHSGQEGVFNIIPETAVLEGNIRTFNNDLLGVITERVKTIAEGISKAHNCTCNVDIALGYPATINDKAIVNKVTPALEALGYERGPGLPLMGSEDFSRYLMKVPGALMFVGTTNDEKPETISNVHNSKLMIDEDAMKIAFEAFLAIYLQMTGQ